MGVVYEAEDSRLGRRVAVKFLPESMAQDTQLTERFQREARAASALNHPNICTIHAIETVGNQNFLVMELLEGQTLGQLMTRQAFSMDKLLPMAIQIADALESAHAKGIVHRDIKPANLFLTDRGQVKILDFGLAKIALAEILDSGSTPSRMDTMAELTSPGAAMGTVSYMSPEQARGQVCGCALRYFFVWHGAVRDGQGTLPFRGESTSRSYSTAILNAARLGHALEPRPATKTSRRSSKKRWRRTLTCGARLPPNCERILSDSSATWTSGRNAAAGKS